MAGEKLFPEFHKSHTNVMVLLIVLTTQKGNAVPSGTNCEKKPQKVLNVGEEHEMGSESPVGPKKGVPSKG